MNEDGVFVIKEKELSSPLDKTKVLMVKRIYHKTKAQNCSLTRRIAIFLMAPESHKDLVGKCIVEYIGHDPKTIPPHGNAKQVYVHSNCKHLFIVTFMLLHSK
jgi:hypothetical protein